MIDALRDAVKLDCQTYASLLVDVLPEGGIKPDYLRSPYLGTPLFSIVNDEDKLSSPWGKKLLRCEIKAPLAETIDLFKQEQTEPLELSCQSLIKLMTQSSDKRTDMHPEVLQFIDRKLAPVYLENLKKFQPQEKSSSSCCIS